MGEVVEVGSGKRPLTRVRNRGHGANALFHWCIPVGETPYNGDFLKDTVLIKQALWDIHRACGRVKLPTSRFPLPTSHFPLPTSHFPPPKIHNYKSSPHYQ